MVNTLGSKNLYKIFLSIIKYIPNILAILKIISLALSYLEITSFFLTCIGGTSLVLLVLLYLISYIFRFCGLYRISLNYVTIITTLTILDWYFNIFACAYPIYFAITGVFVTLWIWFFYRNRNNPKIDHIKQLCDNVCC